MSLACGGTGAARSPRWRPPHAPASSNACRACASVRDEGKHGHDEEASGHARVRQRAHGAKPQVGTRCSRFDDAEQGPCPSEISEMLTWHI